MEWAERLTQYSTATIVASGIALIIGVILIKRGQRQAHMTSMLVACGLAVIFIGLYLTKVGLGFSKEYIGPEAWRGAYFFLLITHMLFAALNLPLVIFAFLNAWKGRQVSGYSLELGNIREPEAAVYFSRHRAWVRYAVPVWLYVAVTGWIIYAVLEQYGRWKT